MPELEFNDFMKIMQEHCERATWGKLLHFFFKILLPAYALLTGRPEWTLVSP